MKRTEVIIIGAGATGLMAAYTLVKAGKTVAVLEARNRIGGRIYTLQDEPDFKHAELGAEFVHGDLPVTLGSLKEAGIHTLDTHFDMWRYSNGAFEESEENVEGWDELLEKLGQLQQDMPIHNFLQHYFPGEKYAAMRAQVTGFVNGYDTADTKDASCFALRNEWNHEDDDAQHRVDGGYKAMVQYLADTIRSEGSEVLLNQVIQEVRWEKGRAWVKTIEDTVYEGPRVIIALPLGVLQAEPGLDGAISFQPSIQAHAGAIQDIGFGSVIKILMAFEESFWQQDKALQASETDDQATRLFTGGEAIPTFWTQAPANIPVLTGWLGGPAAWLRKDMPPEQILQLALESLSLIFHITPEALKEQLRSWQVMNWPAERYTRGSYAYDKVESAEARAVLSQPIAGTIFFAGEYLYDGPAMGTVEAALTSGRNAAQIILDAG